MPISRTLHTEARPYRKRAVLATLAIITLLIWSPGALWAGDNSPVVPVPSDRWGALEPRAVAGDTSDFVFNREPGCEPFWMGLDTEGDYLFAATGNAIQAWDVGSDPDNPELLADPCQPLIGLFKKSDTDFFWFHVDAPPGDPTILGVGLGSKMGTLIMGFNPVNGSFAKLYQDEGETTYGGDYSATGLVALEVGGRQLLFVRTNSSDVIVYDLDRARNVKAPCLEEDGACGQKVYLGKLPGKAVSIAGAGNHLMMLGSNVIDVYDVSTNPVAPTHKGTIKLSNYLIGIGAWTRGNSTWVAGVGFGTVEAYDISCLPSQCGKARIEVDVPGGDFITASTDRVSGKGYLYIGSNQSRVGGPQLEYVIDTDTWEDLTPQEHPAGYWGWYYEGNASGFRNMKALTAVVHDDRIYRGAFSFLDVHQIVETSGPPIANFSWSPMEPYAGDPVDFLDDSTRSPTAWAWTFTGADVSSSSSANPQDVTFLTPGFRSVSLVASNQFGFSDALIKQVKVLDPTPAIGSITPNVTAAPVCSSVEFTADVSGKPPLSFDWDVVDAGDVSTGAGVTSTSDTFTWEVPQDQAEGTYRASLAVTGVSTTSTVFSPVVTIESLADLAFLDGGTPVSDPLTYQPSASTPDFGRVDFQVSAQGATRWTWDFGDGDVNGCPDGFTKVGTACTTSDPAVGVAPSHQYTVADDYEVTVTVENCRDGSITSAVLPLTVDSVAPLVASFAIDPKFCSGNGLTRVCEVKVGQEVPFTDQSGGFPEVWEVDWTGNGTFVSVTPVNGKFTHTYTSPSPVFSPGYKPVLRVSRGSQTSEPFTHEPVVVASGGPTPQPSVSVSRSTSSPLVGATVTFTATVKNCTVPSSWQWNPGSGGSISGSASGSQIKVKYSSAGSKTITATAIDGGCDKMSGSTTVSVRNESNPGPGPGPAPSLTASFTLSPSNPKVGTAVSFDASASSSDATAYLWDFGDGSDGSGKKVSHTYAKAGSYKVTLEVSKPHDDCAFGICVASKETTVVVKKDDPGPPPPPPPPSNGCTGELEDDPAVLCLNQGRFAVRVSFDHPDEGMTPAQAIWHADRTGFFWFFRESNVEVVAKVLDGRSFNNAFWVFYGSLTNRDYKVEVTDLETGERRVFDSEAGEEGGIRCGQQVVDAFPVQAASEGASTYVTAEDRGGLTAKFSYTVDGNTVQFDASGSLGSPQDYFWDFGDGKTAFGKTTAHTFAAAGTYKVTLEVSKDEPASCDFLCAHSVSTQVVVGESGSGGVEGEEPTGGDGGAGDPSETLSLLNDRFDVSVAFRFVDLSNGEVKAEGTGKAIEGTDQSGYFWFNRSDNLELVVKMVDASTFTGEYWIFWAGLTNFEYTLTVTDKVTGQTWTRVKPQQQYCGGAVTDFFKVAP